MVKLSTIVTIVKANTTACQGHDSPYNYVVADRFYPVLFSALGHTHCALSACDS